MDDLDNRYPLVLPEGGTFVGVPAASAVRGTLVFAGRIDPAASSVGVGLNAGSGSAAEGGRLFPELVVRDIPLSGEATLGPLPEPVAADEVADHPAGVRLAVDGLIFSDSGAEVAVSIINEGSEPVALAAASTFAHDDVGNRYPLVPLSDNPQLVVEGDTTLEATLAFSGRVADGAEAVSLVFNDGGSEDDAETRQPSFLFGPYQLQRSADEPEVVEAEVFAVGDRTRLVPADLAVSRVDRITETLEEFDAAEVDGGFSLTLPDSILFDFGSAELREDALAALTLIAEVLDYYEDADVVVAGHTDSVGSAAANQRLSEERARSVMDALVSDHGVPEGRLRAEGRGDTEPVAPNEHPDGTDNPEGRQLNRRVEILVLTDEPLQVP